MSKKLYECIEITDLKDMLNKTRNIYADKPAYKIRTNEGEYKVFTHGEVRNMIFRNCSLQFRLKRQKNCCNGRK